MWFVPNFYRGTGRRSSTRTKRWDPGVRPHGGWVTGVLATFLPEEVQLAIMSAQRSEGPVPGSWRRAYN